MLIKLDTRLGWLNSSLISFNQLSVGTSKLEFEITENNQPKDLTDLRVMIEIKTPSGSIQEEHVTIIDAVSGKIEKDLSAPMLTEEGSHYGELSLYSQDNTKLLCTHKFRYIVGSNYGEQGAKQTSQYATLQTCIMEVKGLEKEVGNNIEEIEISKNLAEQAKNEAKQSKVESMQSASNSIQSSIAAERSAESALETSGTLDQVVEMAKQSAEASKQSAGASQASADAAERAKDVVLQSVEQSNAASKTANQASVNAEQALRDAIVSKDTAKQAEISATTSANEASKAEASANNSKAILEQKIQEIETVKEAVDSTVATANTALQQANTAIVKAKEISEENKNITLQATQTAGRAEDAISNANTANQTANQKLIDTTEQANIAKEQVLLAKDEVTKAQAETAKATEQATIATTKSEEATTQADRATREADRAGAQAQEKVNNKIGLNGVHDDTIFNFIENQVVQDGLVDINIQDKEWTTGSSNAYRLTQEQSDGDFTFIGRFIYTLSESSDKAQHILCSTYNDRNTDNIYFRGTNIIINDKTFNKQYNYGDLIQIAITKINNRIRCVVNDELIGEFERATTQKLVINGNRAGGYSICKKWLTSHFYNHALTQQEIQHNFSVLNNPPSIKELRTTDSAGKTSILKLASDEDHIEMASGRTLREEYMGVLKTMGKEFTSADGSPVEVNNGIEARVISAEIKGQTVKNLFPTNNNIVTQQSMFSSIISQCQRLTPSTKYVFGVFVTKFTEQSKLYFKLNTANDVLSEYVEIPITKLGLNYIEKVVNSTSEKLGTVMIPSTEWGVEAKKFEFKNVYIADGVLYDNPQFGLNSTQAIIANNGQQYPIYANEEDKANKKVILLGGVGWVYDTLEIKDDGSVVYTQRNAKHVVDGTRPFGMSSQNETLIGIGEFLPAGTFKVDLNNIRIISDKIKCKKGMDCKPNAWGITSRDASDESYIAVWDKGHVMAVLQKSVYGNNIDEVKSYLNTNPLTIIGQLATPIVTHIPKELVPAILTHNQTNILEVVGKVKASSFKVTLPVDRIAELTARLEAVEAKTNTQPINTAFVDETYAKSVNKIEEVIK